MTEQPKFSQYLMPSLITSLPSLINLIASSPSLMSLIALSPSLTSLIALSPSLTSLIASPPSLIVLPLSYLARSSNPFLTLTIEYFHVQHYAKDYDADCLDIALLQYNGSMPIN